MYNEAKGEHNVKVRVSYTVSYIAEVEVDGLCDLQDAISDIDIPEGGINKSRYISDSFEPMKLQGIDGKWINIEDLEFLC
jgi:hypothetical protein